MDETSKEYILASGLYCFKTNNDHLRFVLAETGKVIDCRFSKTTISLLRYFETHSNISSFLRENQELSSEQIIRIVKQLKDLGIIRNAQTNKRKVRCLLLGAGSVGSHIFQHLSPRHIERLVIVDDDVVETDNIFRQCYTKEDVGNQKACILAKRQTCIREVYPELKKVYTDRELESLVYCYGINIIIQAADYPNGTDVSRMIVRVGNKCQIPVIVNMGYTGESVAFPEFYYPNLSYTFSVGRTNRNDTLLFYHSGRKASYSTCSELGNLVAKQIDDFQHHIVPIGYGERGYYNVAEHKWKTNRITSRISIEPIS